MWKQMRAGMVRKIEPLRGDRTVGPVGAEKSKRVRRGGASGDHVAGAGEMVGPDHLGEPAAKITGGRRSPKSKPSATGGSAAARDRTASTRERFTTLEDGGLSNGKVERFALFMADGVSAAAAYRFAGYKDDTGYSKDWKRRCERDPAFVARVKALTEERMEAERSASPFAMARYTASQLWRDARAQGDMSAAAKASDLLFKIAQQEVLFAGAGGSLPGPVPSTDRPGPGRPATELQQTKNKSIDTLRQELLAKEPTE